MADPLVRLQHLLGLAGSSNENEARNAAVEACKLIKLHKLVISLPQTQSRIPNTPPQRPTQSADDVMRNGEVVDGLTGDLSDLFRRADHFARRAREVVGEAEEDRSPHVITAPQDGTCRDCGDDYRRGEQIWYRRGVGAVHHMKCDPAKLVSPRPRRV